MFYLLNNVKNFVQLGLDINYNVLVKDAENDLYANFLNVLKIIC